MLTPLKALRFKDSLGPGSSCQEVWMGWHLCRQTCWSILPQYRAYVIYVCSVLALFLSYAAFNYCAHFLRNWGCWTGEWKEHNMWYIYICMYVCSVLALFLSCANMYACSFLKLFICCATFNYCALLLIRNWWCWTGEWKEHMWYIYIYICMCAQSWHYFLAVQPSTIVHFCLGIGGGGKVSGKSICEIYIYIYMYVCSVLALFPSCATFN